MSDADRKPGEKGPRPQRDVPEGFTLALALVDAVPVALFCASAAVFGTRVQSPLFAAGAATAALAGLTRLPSLALLATLLLA
ncbi:hypothetical protein [Paratractidigestivibacter faecalis]|uniref:Uncharacterized protein n=1 Tax=Paratractidigestivibacter faecalis TaxID=2292441 RepID=A0ABV1IFG4_9ACTN